jgi:hypothetical protein
MDLERIRELLPFYVNGTLTPDERAMVEEALASSIELQRELRFWERAADALHETHGHLSAQQIVERAKGKTSADDRQTQDRHLARCTECSELLQRTQATLASTGTDDTAQPRTRFAVWKYAAAAVFVLGVILFVVRDAPPLHTDIQGTSLPGVTVARPIPSITLTYQPVMRAADNRQPAPVALNDADSLIHMRFAIPRTTVNGIHYSLWRERDHGKRVMIAAGLVRSGYGESYDTVAVDVSRPNLPAPHQQLRLVIREELPQGASALTPEEYSFDLAGQPAP